MKLNKLIFPAMACMLALGSCDDQVMEWKESDSSIKTSDIPLALKEKLANYKMIKEYASEYTPNMLIGLGLGADLYIASPEYRQIADDNFQMFTCGNAMKHASVVQNNGNLNFTTIDNFLDAVPDEIPVYGHNFIWHTQQKQTYLRSLIAPEVIIESSGDDDVCENVITNSGFENGTTGYTGLWGKYTYTIESPGKDSDNAIRFTMTDETAVSYDCQLFWQLDTPLEDGVTYAFSCDIKSDMNITVQFMGQNASYSGIYKDSFTAPSSWLHVTGEFTYNEADCADITKVGFQFGGTPGSNVWFDNFKFGVKKVEKMKNIITNSSFVDGTTGYTGLWGKYQYAVEAPGRTDDFAIRFTMTDETTANYDSQLFWALDTPLEDGATYAYSCYVKSDMNITVQFMGQNASYSGIYKEQFTAPSDWLLCEGEFTYDAAACADITKVGFQFGGTPGSTVWFDDFKFGLKNEEAAQMSARTMTRATGVTYIFKTAEEKRELLLNAMENWIKGIAEHTNSRVTAWDVINEPIADNTQWRGIDGNGFMSEDGTPEESAESGLNLNWADDHFYWGYYLGKEYATKAFEYARQYTADGCKLFVNDYNLETNPGKLNALIEFVKYIDENNETHGPIVDGIGTQMHVTASSITREQVDNMFKTMTATGKLIRVTELDVALGTSSPSAEQLELQSNVYRMIFESYKENVPENQQSGITIWTLSDNANEHEYWLNGDTPNLFDANYERKHAYKGVCDGIAGKDISEEFSGDMWNTEN